ncbi:unnamed protein product [Effrenium voratum]|nr:unnamed protein product [Effrenium voratum]
MAAPRTLEQWFQQVPHLVSDQHWELAVRQHHRSLYHCACPWGGRLLKVKAGSVRESGLVRPEVRAAKCPDTKLLQHLAPGEAVLLSKDWSHVFENLAAHAPSEAKAVTQRLRRDFPEEGDSALTFEGESRGLLLCRPKDGSNELTGIFQVSEEQFTQWSSIHLMLLLDSASRGARSFLSRAEEDADFYSVLTVQSCRRGLPLIPSDPTEVATVSITAGQSAGLENWTRFSPEMTEGSRFCVADYVRTFAARLGLALATYDSLDGQRLVPYQCVVARQGLEMPQWEGNIRKGSPAYRSVASPVARLGIWGSKSWDQRSPKFSERDGLGPAPCTPPQDHRHRAGDFALGLGLLGGDDLKSSAPISREVPTHFAQVAFLEAPTHGL